MRPLLARALLAIATAPLKRPEPESPPIDPMDFARNLVDVANRQHADHRRAMADAFGANMAANLAEHRRRLVLGDAA